LGNKKEKIKVKKDNFVAVRKWEKSQSYFWLKQGDGLTQNAAQLN